jgi:AraC-like DNA-binding protein
VPPGQNWPVTSHGRNRPGWIEPLRVIYDHELVLFREGRYVVEIAGAEFACPADRFIIVPPGQLHATWDAAGQAGHRYWSHFDWAFQGPHGAGPMMTYHPAKPQMECLRPAPAFVPRTVLHGTVPNPVRAYELAERLCALHARGSDHDRCISRALLLELLLELLDTRDRAVSASAGEAGLADRVRDALDRAADRHGDVRIQAMLQGLGYSYEHLCRVFRSAYGIPPLRYLHSIHIGRAKLLLRDTDLKVSEIARRLGFDDPLYFSQLFRKLTGISPSDYARSVRMG